MQEGDHVAYQGSALTVENYPGQLGKRGVIVQIDGFYAVVRLDEQDPECEFLDVMLSELYLAED